MLVTSKDTKTVEEPNVAPMTERKSRPRISRDIPNQTSKNV